ncbi:dehydrogenase [Kocuria sp. CNJ-770]|uniref:zinc-dependent alcohol dehydrogenase n=1 Tax=Kocuria sp. CNJ-770 TaxID=1904964 RepID=UPI000961FDDD|nr:zinc-binding alcohol dehydrogenase [Kocuria sp. CNJ-770]OLT08090.1 dehydrogenase [Kocuria sp. CNJ-770]
MTDAAQQPRTNRAYWTVEPGRGELRTAPLPAPGPDEVLVRALRSGISRGTERLVHRGLVPARVHERMRAPFQEGTFPGPVKYGYLSVGVVEQGPQPLVGRRVFVLHPHQDRYVVPAADVTPVPDGVPSDRAVLAGPVETAVNALWEAAPRFGDRVAVVGAGMIGACTAALLARFPLARLQLVDPQPSRAGLARAIGVEHVRPEDAAGECDVVVHASSTAEGLARGLELLGDEGELIEMSWYGDEDPAVPLGADFHARRLQIRASQVGVVAPARRARRTPADRRAAALDALRDPRFDALLTGSSPFEELPATMARLAGDAPEALCHVVRYD